MHRRTFLRNGDATFGTMLSTPSDRFAPGPPHDPVNSRSGIVHVDQNLLDQCAHDPLFESRVSARSPLRSESHSPHHGLKAPFVANGIPVRLKRNYEDAVAHGRFERRQCRFSFAKCELHPRQRHA